jgi:endonuclease-3
MASPKGRNVSVARGRATGKLGATAAPRPLKGAPKAGKGATAATAVKPGRGTSKPVTLPRATKSKKPATVDAAIARATFAVLKGHHSDAHCELDHRSPFELVVATVLSAQSTDVMVNQVTPELFRRWPTPDKLAKANPADVEKAIGRLGFFRQKTKSIVGLSQKLVADHGGEVPRTLAELVKLPGVGRKTANVVLGVAFGTPEGVVVDTHVQRLSQRLGWTKHDEPVEIEQDLMRVFPRDDWDAIAHVLIFHGRRICTARKPACAACPVADKCPSAFHAEQVGRKPPRLRFVERQQR